MRSLTPLLLALVTLISLVAARPAVANEDDLFWDAYSIQNGVELDATYKESPENGLIDQTLEVQLEDAPSNVTVFISINGRVIGSMTTDVTGRGEFRMDRLGVTPGPDGRPIGQRIETGDVIRVFRGATGISATFRPRP
ncbi:MAG: hypothetical protein ACF8PN_12530 [Phycisphaerales bacterium]